jgi:transposase
VRVLAVAAFFSWVLSRPVFGRRPSMLVELGLVEQRCQAVLEVLNDGASVTDVVRRHGVARQTVHVWSNAYAAEGLRGLADRSSRPQSCPRLMAPEVEARIVVMRREHPGWGSRTILTWLAREGWVRSPRRTSIDRCLVRHGLVTPQARRGKRSDGKLRELRFYLGGAADTDHLLDRLEPQDHLAHRVREDQTAGTP